MKLRKDLSHLGTTIFATMSRLASELSAINLGQGYPDTDGPASIKEHAIEAIRSGYNQYAPGDGYQVLREAVAHHQKRFWGAQFDPSSEILITAGATEAIAASLLAFVDPGDKVAMFEPFYDAYYAATLMARGQPIPIRLYGKGFHFDFDLLDSVMKEAKILILNDPHNPTGKVFSFEELSHIARLAETYGVTVIADQVYEHLVYDAEFHPTLNLFDPSLLIHISSAAKTFGLTGWKIGWVSAKSELVNGIRTTKQFLTYTNGAPFQIAIAWALDHAEELIPLVREPLKQQRDYLTKGLAELGYEVYPSRATYFAISDLAGSGLDPLSYCKQMARDKGVVTIPTSAFYLPGEKAPAQIRWTFSKRIEILEEALERLR
jgi:N-succinyldiaminopimelate aminotransferase